MRLPWFNLSIAFSILKPQWLLTVTFIPSLALCLGIWGNTSKLFEVIYPILWYLGPFNRDSWVALFDYLGAHPQSPSSSHPEYFAAFVLLLMVLAYLGRRRQMLR